MTGTDCLMVHTAPRRRMPRDDVTRDTVYLVLYTHWVLHGLAAAQDTAAQSAQLDATPASTKASDSSQWIGVVAEHAMDHRPLVPPPQRYQTTRNGWTEAMLFVTEVRRGEEMRQQKNIKSLRHGRHDETRRLWRTRQANSSRPSRLCFISAGSLSPVGKMDVDILHSRRPNRTPSSVVETLSYH